MKDREPSFGIAPHAYAYDDLTGKSGNYPSPFTAGMKRDGPVAETGRAKRFNPPSSDCQSVGGNRQR